MSHVLTGIQIDMFRLKMLQRGLEAECRGMRLTAKGSSCYNVIKREFGLRGSKENVLKQFKVMLEGMTQTGTV